MPYIVEIPERTHEDFGDGISKLISISALISKSFDNEIVLDFRKVKFLNPFFIGGLVSIIRKLIDKGVSIEIKLDSTSSIISYLNTIFFPYSLTPKIIHGEKELKINLEKYKTKSYIPIVGFNTGSSFETTVVREKVLSAISELIKTQLKFSESEMAPLRYFIAELTDNINEHSKSSLGYVFAQYYPNSNFLDLCICDPGQGILNSYLNNQKFNPPNETEALKLALMGKSTKDLPESRGFGISTTRNMLVNGLRGRLFIWSGNSAFIQGVDNEAIITVGKAYFQGTFIALRLPTILPGTFDFYKYVEG